MGSEASPTSCCCPLRSKDSCHACRHSSALNQQRAIRHLKQTSACGSRWRSRARTWHSWQGTHMVPKQQSLRSRHYQRVQCTPRTDRAPPAQITHRPQRLRTARTDQAPPAQITHRPHRSRTARTDHETPALITHPPHRSRTARTDHALPAQIAHPPAAGGRRRPPPPARAEARLRSVVGRCRWQPQQHRRRLLPAVPAAPAAHARATQAPTHDEQPLLPPPLLRALASQPHPLQPRCWAAHSPPRQAPSQSQLLAAGR
jgi:hypothetical protein